MTLRRALMRMCNLWPHLFPGRDAHLECPIGFSEEETRGQAESDPMWYNLNALVSHWHEELGGFSEEGWIPAEV